MRSRLKYGLHSGRCVKLRDGYAVFGAYFEAARSIPLRPGCCQIICPDGLYAGRNMVRR
jgi:hypothetical protein